MCTHLKSLDAEKEASELKWKAWLVIFDDSVITAGQRRCTCKHGNAPQTQLVPQAFTKIIRSSVCVMNLVLFRIEKYFINKWRSRSPAQQLGKLIYGEPSLKVITGTKHSEDECVCHTGRTETLSFCLCSCAEYVDKLSPCV